MAVDPMTVMKIDMFLGKLKKLMKDGNTEITEDQLRKLILSVAPNAPIDTLDLDDPLSMMSAFLPQEKQFLMEYAKSKLTDIFV